MLTLGVNLGLGHGVCVGGGDNSPKLGRNSIGTLGFVVGRC